MRLGALLLYSTIAAGQVGVPVEIRVLNAITREPLEEVALHIVPARQQSAEPREALTDSMGQARVLLPPGAYVMRGSRHDLGSDYYGHITDTVIRTIRVEAGVVPDPVEFLLTPPASVHVTVRDEAGDPVPRAMVSILRGSWSNGRIKFGPAGTANADERGVAALPMVQPGRYVICAEPSPQGPRELPVLGVIDAQSSAAPRVYQRTCVPGASIQDAITVAPGVSVRETVTLDSARPVRISGTVGPTHSAGLNLRRADGGFLPGISAGTDPETGEFVFQGVPPGDYVLQADASRPVEGGRSEPLFGSTAVTVAGGDVGGIQIELGRRPTVTLAYEGDSERFAANVTDLGLTQGQMSFPLRKGEVLQGLRPEQSWIYQYTKDNTCITGLRLDDQDVFRQTFLLTDKDHRLTLRLSDRCGTMKIKVVDQGQPVSNAKFAILMSGTPSEPGYLYLTSTDENGEETITGLAAGQYLVWAWAYDPSERYLGPDVSRVRPAIIDIGLGDTERIQIAVTAGDQAR